MYKVASDLAQRRARQLWLVDLVGTDFDELSITEQVECLRGALRNLEARIRSTPNGPDRKVLAKQITEVHQILKDTKPRFKQPRSLNCHFMTVAKERLSPFQFKLMFIEAARRADAEQAGAASSSTH